MGGKQKPAFVLANRDEFTRMDYEQLRKHREKVLPGLQRKADKLQMELTAHLTRMRVKHEVKSDGISLFPDADGWELRGQRVQFNVMFFNWPEVPNGRMRLAMLKNLESATPTWFRIKKVSVLEPVKGFDTLTLAKNLRALRSQFIAKRKAKNIDADNRMKSRRLANQVSMADFPDNTIVSTSGSCTDPERFELKIIYLAVTPNEAEAILAPLREAQ